MNDILILGGDISGINAALYFKERGFCNFIVIEKESELGGYAEV